MTLVGIICGLTCLIMMIAIVWKPQAVIGGIHFDTYPFIALFGCLALLLTGSLPLSRFIEGLTADSAVNPIKILILFLAMTFLSVYLDEAGFFHYLAGITLKRAGSDQRKLLRSLFFTVSFLTIFTSNDIVVLTFTPFIAYFAKAAQINPTPYLVAEFVAANTFSMIFIIGNPTNIYLATGAGIGFMEYCKVMVIPTVFAGLAVYLVISVLFRKMLKKEISTTVESEPIRHWPTVVLGLVHLGVCTVLMVVSSYVDLPMWGIAAGAAGSLIVCTLIVNAVTKRGPRLLFRSLHRLPWLLAPFVLAMFGLVMAMEHCGLTGVLTSVLMQGNPIWTYGITSALAANIINNIPMSVLYFSLLSGGEVGQAAIYASVIGSNLGAYLTPVGALAGIMWMSILKRLDISFSFREFVSYGIRIAIPALVASLVGLMISDWLFL